MTAVFAEPYELAFAILAGDLPTPVVETTWGRLKGHYEQ
jgi:hypothetical protein